MKALVRALLLATGLLAGSTVVYAAVVSSAECDYYVNDFDIVVTTNPSNCAVAATNVAGGVGTVTAFATRTPGTSVRASASESGDGLLVSPDFFAQGYLSYDFHVNGGQPGDRVPLLMVAALTLPNFSDSESLYANASAYESVTGGPAISACIGGFNCGTPAHYSVCYGPFSCTYPDQLPGEYSMTAVTGNNIQVLLTASASVDGQGGSFMSMSATAFADPYFEIDPSFPNASLYSLVFDAGIGNALPAPEPSTFLLIGTGLLGMASETRRRWPEVKTRTVEVRGRRSMA